MNLDFSRLCVEVYFYLFWWVPKSGIVQLCKYTFSFVRSCQIVFQSIFCFILSPQEIYESSNFSRCSPAPDIVNVFKFSSSSGCAVRSHCDFNINFSNRLMVWASLCGIIAHVFIFWEFQIFCPFLYWVTCHRIVRALYVFWIQILGKILVL